MLLHLFGFSLSCSSSLSESQEAITQKDTRAISSPTSCHAGILARFLSLSGHVALRHMVHLDVGVLGEIKRRQVIEENDKENEKQAKKTKGTGSESTVNSTKVAKNLGQKWKRFFFLQQLEKNDLQISFCIVPIIFSHSNNAEVIKKKHNFYTRINSLC